MAGVGTPTVTTATVTTATVTTAAVTTAAGTGPAGTRPVGTRGMAAVGACPEGRPRGRPASPRRVLGGGHLVGRRVAAHHQRAPVAAVVALLALLSVGGPLAGLVAGTTTGPETSRPVRAPAPGPAGASVHVVQPGETYWSIAAGAGPPGDLRPRVDALMAANGGRLLRAGDRLVVSLRNDAG